MNIFLHCVIAGLTATFFFYPGESLAAERPVVPASAVTGSGKPATPGMSIVIDSNKPAGPVTSALRHAGFNSIKKSDNGKAQYSYAALYERIETLKDLAIRNGCSEQYGILVDLDIVSGHKRFFIIDLSAATIIGLGLVSTESRQAADLAGVYTTEYAPAANAVSFQNITRQPAGRAARNFILQSTSETPDDEVIFPIQTTGKGFSLAPGFFAEVSEVLHNAGKPVMVWVYQLE